MGDTARPAPDLLLRAGGRLPPGARIELFRNGARIAVGHGAIEVPAREPGAYRVEVRVPGWEVPWILSNPIYVYGAAETVVRARRAALGHRPRHPRRWPRAPWTPSRTGRRSWRSQTPERGSISEVRVASDRAPGTAAARLHFRLAQPRPDPSAVWGALVDRARRDLSRDSGLVFHIRADGVYRIWVALWEERPGHAGGEPDWWQSSVRTTTEWRRLAIPFERLYPADTNVDEVLDLRRVGGLVFYIDPRTDEPVREGSVWLDGLGAY